MTDRVIEIQLVAPRPNLLSLLAQPELAVLRDRFGTGPFTVAPSKVAGRELRLTRQILASDDEEATQREEVLIAGASATEAVRTFADDKVVCCWAAPSRICRWRNGPNCRGTPFASIRRRACSD